MNEGEQAGRRFVSSQTVHLARGKSIFRALVNSSWFLFKWALALCVIAALVGVPYFYAQLGNEIRDRLQEKIAAHYPDLEVRIGSARLTEEGIEIRDLTFAERFASGPKPQLARFDEILVKCQTDLTSLLEEKLDIERIVMRRPTLQITRRADDTWSVTRLLPMPTFSKKPASLSIEDGVAEIFDPQKNPSSTFILRDVQLQIDPPEQSDSASGEMVRKVTGTLTGNHLGEVQFDGSISDGGAQWQFAGTSHGMELSPELGSALPGEPHGPVDLLRSLRAVANVRFVVSNPVSDDMLARYELRGELIRGRIDDDRLPYPLTGVRGTMFCDNERFQITQFEARHGPTVLRLECAGRRQGDRFPFRIEADCKSLVLDRLLHDALPERWRDEWRKYDAAGDVDVNLVADYDGHQWDPGYELRVACHNVAFSYHLFPYRLEATRGSIVRKAGRTTADLTAFAGTEEVRIKGSWRGSGNEAVGSVEASGNRMPIDRKLLAALDARGDSTGAVIRRFQPEGIFHFDLRFWREAAGARLRHEINLTLDNCTVRYDAFAYPLFNVRGAMHGRDGNWTFHNLEGRNDTGWVTCQGSLRRTPEGHELAVDLRARQIPLEPELRDAMRPSLMRLWDDLRPRGEIDAHVQVRARSGQARPQMTVWLWPRAEETSIEPVFLPYRLENLKGEFHYANGRGQIEGLSCSHGAVKVEGQGSCELAGDGSWRLDLDRFAVDRLRADRELQQALPPRLRKAVQKLDPQGPLNLSGSLELAGGGPAASSPSASSNTIRAGWNVEVQFQQTRITCGVPLENLHGSVRLDGGFDGTRFQSTGELNLESLIYRDLQFTAIRGPIWIDDEIALFGSHASGRRGERQPRPVTASAYGGTVTADGEIRLGAKPTFSLRASLVNAKLERLAQEVFTGRQQLDGNVVAELSLQGSAEGAHTLTGGGSIRLREADIYRLPQMISLLKIVSVRPPDATAFTASDIDFRIDGGHAYFDRMSFNGDAISLIGTGQMNLDGEIAMTFYAVVGRNRFQVPLVGDVFRGASQQMMLVRAKGKLREPQIIREPFPGVQQALQQLQATLQGRPDGLRRRLGARGSPGHGTLLPNRLGSQNHVPLRNAAPLGDRRIRAIR